MIRYIVLFSLICFLGCSKSSTGLTKNTAAIEKDVKWARYQQNKTKVADKAIKSTDDVSYFDIDPEYRVNASFQKSNSTESINIPTYSGIQKEFYKYGVASFALKGYTYKLTIYKNIIGIENKKYKEYLFLPFMDLSNGEESYGGGRYIDLKTKDIKDGYVEIDFNKAYNPYCAYGDGWNCPIPPAENHLKISILVGESAYTGPKNDREL